MIGAKKRGFILLLRLMVPLFFLHAAAAHQNRAADTIALIPKPHSMRRAAGAFALTAETRIHIEPGSPEIAAIGGYLAEKLRPATGFELPVTEEIPAKGHIRLALVDADPALGEEGYALTVDPGGVALTAYRPAGLFRGVQTIRQLLPPAIESRTAQPGPWKIPAVSIRDVPRFVWRGVMLDVARHFFPVADVKHLIEIMAYYKMNRLHLHLTDDQGWRLAIDSWPKLATYGGSTAVGGDPGGHYTKAEYAEIVRYAQSRYITIVPEIEMPGHTNAALASYPELNRDGKAPPLYTGTRVGFSSLCPDKEITYEFVSDVIGEVAALTPGPYIHIGGDEVATLSRNDYARFIGRVLEIVENHGKRAIGWEEIARAKLVPGTIVQHWNINPALAGLSRTAVAQGAKAIVSKASKAYMDMKYNPKSPLGATWAGYIEVREGYAWEPTGVLDGVTEQDVLGVEAPLWTETIRTRAEMEYMILPRLPGYAEIGWSPAAGREWDEYKARLGAHGPRWEAMGMNYYRSGQVPWIT